MHRSRCSKKVYKLRFRRRVHQVVDGDYVGLVGMDLGRIIAILLRFVKHLHTGDIYYANNFHDQMSTLAVVFSVSDDLV